MRGVSSSAMNCLNRAVRANPTLRGPTDQGVGSELKYPAEWNPSGMENPNPIIYGTVPRLLNHSAVNPPDVLTPEYMFELIRDINDPEYPNTLEQLAVVRTEHIFIDPIQHHIRVDFTPTIPHCSMATLIGLCIRVRLQRVLSPAWELDVFVRERAHVAEDSINKQLNDKERVAAAMENPHLVSVVEQCLSGEPKFGIALSVE